MMRRVNRVSAGLSLAVLAWTVGGCGGSSASHDVPPPSSTPDAGEVDAAADSGASAQADATADAPVLPSGTPIQWADQWVAGFYGSAEVQGVNTYSNTDKVGFPDGYYTQWKGEAGAVLFANVSDCSSFSDMLLERSYGWTPATTNVRPLAEDYYWAIRGGHGFAEITQAQNMRAGDTIALLYPPGGMDTGHVAWVDAAPTSFTRAPLETGLTEYVVTVVDSTDGFHDGPNGPTPQADDRYLGPALGGAAMCATDDDCISVYGPNARCNTTQLIDASVCALSGVGRGQMRLYVDASGTIAGHTWSPDALSTFYPRPSPLPTQGGTFEGEDIVVGRIVKNP